MINNIDELFEKAKVQKTMKLVVAAAQDTDVLEAVSKAAEEKIILPILVGDKNAIESIAKEKGLDISPYEIIDECNLTEVARISVKLVSDGKADFLMKGLIDTAILLRAVLDKEIGLRTDSQLSHVMIYELENYHKLLFLTDGGMNITPTLEEKIKITKNAIDVAKAIGIETVKIAALAAKEKVNPKMPSTVDARSLQEECEKGTFGSGVLLEGPLAFDLAVSKEAAKVKGFSSKIAGDTDILVVPSIEMGNGIGKSFSYIAKGRSAGVIMGAKVPVVLVSRADSYDAKLSSIALGSVIAANM
ncbi:bifunctional enoyl-CoA hydratase/phosphate acetyltransferase [Helicovermis profundi]|uniref:Bifunctional enoyl-CoA hydratase/phosphate acetyltransferase n=1 Tax=Helicovermis profundi TaxID=3065157 RepID=A0AAU9E9Y0_9FIRM|nr:bifunctional enoyl-CoA hydratase/phosphate acetyltransferase [Clostridia bacterium S502]